MAAICDAARLGRSIKGSTIYCTTFPCHNCSKHILASGIKRVVYLEPYIKSRVSELHSDEIAIGKVSFVPFMGISPYRYKLIFQKGRRKDGDGTAHEWYQNKKRLRTEVALPTYIMSEKWALGSLLGQVESGS
jgi:deoxycytidylate deaminase